MLELPLYITHHIALFSLLDAFMFHDAATWAASCRAVSALDLAKAAAFLAMTSAADFFSGRPAPAPTPPPPASWVGVCGRAVRFVVVVRGGRRALVVMQLEPNQVLLVADLVVQDLEALTDGSDALGDNAQRRARDFRTTEAPELLKRER